MRLLMASSLNRLTEVLVTRSVFVFSPMSHDGTLRASAKTRALSFKPNLSPGLTSCSFAQCIGDAKSGPPDGAGARDMDSNQEFGQASEVLGVTDEAL